MPPEQTNAPTPIEPTASIPVPFWERKIIWILLAAIILIGGSAYFFIQQKSFSKTNLQNEPLTRPEPQALTDVPAGVHARIEYIGDPQPSKFCSYYQEQLVISTPTWSDKVFPLGTCAMSPFSIRISPTGNLVELWASEDEGEEAFVFNLINETTIISSGVIDATDAPQLIAQISYVQSSPIIWLLHKDGFVMSANGINTSGDREEGIYLWLSITPTRLTTVATVPDPNYRGPKVTTLENLRLNPEGTVVNYSVVTKDEQSGNIIEQVNKSFAI